MSNIHTIPTYANFRTALDRLYPDMKGRIAVCDLGGRDDSSTVAHALKVQLAPSHHDTLSTLLVSAIETLRRSRRKDVSRKNDVGFICLPLNPDVAVIIADCLGMEDVSNAMYLFSDESVPPHRLVFNAASVTPGIMGWMHFYHEVSHAMIGLGRHTLHKRDECDIYIEESICDSFAALHMVKQFGVQVLPFLDAFADMRLSRLQNSGPKYFSALSLRAIVNDVRAGDLDDLGMANVDDIFAGALAYARNNDMDREVVSAFHAAQDSGALFLFPIVHQYMWRVMGTSLGKTSLRDTFKESQTIVWDRYLDQTPVRSTVRAIWKKCFG